MQSLRTFSATGLMFAVLLIAPMGAKAAASATIDTDSLTTTSTKPTIRGSAEDTDHVRVVITSEKGKKVFNKTIKVSSKDEWKAKPSKKLANGEYDVAVYAGKNVKGKPAMEGTLSVGKSSGDVASSGKGTALSVSSVPLLAGGIARPLTSVPVAYVKVTNTSKIESGIDGITLVQNGSAPTSVITAFTTSDNLGGSRATTTITNSSFKKNAVFVPLKASIPAGGFRIFTIKAAVGSSAISNVGKSLVLDVQSVSTAAKVSGMFPVRGTTWMLGF